MYQTTKKRASGPKCSVTAKKIQGVCSVYVCVCVYIYLCFGVLGLLLNLKTYL